MKKRFVSVVLLTMVLLTGCAGSDVQQLTGMDAKVVEKPVQKQEPISGKEPVNVVVEPVDVVEGYEALQNFSYELFEQNIEETNPVLSPVSAYLAMALTGAGARGETLTEFQTVMGDLEGVPYDLMNGLPKEEEGMIITLANSAWVDTRLTPDEEWLGKASNIYRADVWQAPLATEETKNRMNQWVDEKTNGMIKSILDKPLDEDARLALLNTIYFKGEWQRKFSANATTEREFHLEDGTTKQVEMMQMYEENQKYVKNAIAEGVVLPYRDTTKAFVALKPVGELTVREMYAQLEQEDISAFLQQEEWTLCNLRLPKFEVEFDKKLNDSLQTMGIEKAFVEGEADFSGLGTLDTGLGMFIELVYQKAKVIVDEEGTEAAAVTMVVVATESLAIHEKPPIDIYFDEPFLYMIMDVEREIPLFVGIMDNPGV